MHKPAEYLGRALSMESWRRLLEGDVSLLRVLKIYLTRPRLAVQSWIRDMARRLHIRLKNDVGRELQQLAARGIRIVFVFSRGDAGIVRFCGRAQIRQLVGEETGRTLPHAHHRRRGPQLHAQCAARAAPRGALRGAVRRTAMNARGSAGVGAQRRAPEHRIAANSGRTPEYRGAIGVCSGKDG